MRKKKPGITIISIWIKYPIQGLQLIDKRQYQYIKRGIHY